MNEIAVVTEQDIPDILRMIHEIYSELPNKEWFSLDSDEEVTSYMMTGGFGLKAMCDGRLAGVFIARAKNLGDENLGYDLKFDEEQRKQSAHMEIAMVRKEYRGQGLQRKMMEESEQILKEQGCLPALYQRLEPSFTRVIVYRHHRDLQIRHKILSPF